MGYIGNQDYNIIEANIGTVTGTDTAANIIALPNDNGALWIASDTGHLFLNDGFKWHDLGQLQGDTGPQGVGVTGISKTSTSGLVDTYIVTFSDTATTTYTITNGKGIVGVARTSGDGSEGTLDTYTIMYNDSTTSTYDVYNGADGNTWLTGSIAPLAGDGSDGDLYLNTATSFYYEKVTGAWVLKGTLKGDAYSYSAAGALAGRGAYDTEAAGFGYLSLDEAVPTVYFKLSSTSGDWSVGTAVGRGAGISSVTNTGTLGNVDTYTITYDDLSTSTFTVTNANIDDSQITATNTWSAEKIALALGDATSKPTFTTDAVTNISGITATFNGTISDFGDASNTLQYRFIYGTTSAMEEGATPWTAVSSLGAVSARVAVNLLTTTYYALMQLRDTNKPDSMGLLPVPADWAAERTSFLSGSDFIDSDSYIYLQGTGGTGYSALNSTTVPNITNGLIINNEVVLSGTGSAITYSINQDGDEGDFSAITPSFKVRPYKFTINGASTSTTWKLDTATTGLLTNGSKVIATVDGVDAEYTLGSVSYASSQYTCTSITPTPSSIPTNVYQDLNSTAIYASATAGAGKVFGIDSATALLTLTVDASSTASVPVFTTSATDVITTGSKFRATVGGIESEYIAGTVTKTDPSAGVYKYTIASTTPVMASNPTTGKVGYVVLTHNTSGLLASGDVVSMNSGTAGANQNVAFASVSETLINGASSTILDLLADGSCKASYQFENNANDTSGTYNGIATNVTYGTGKFGQCAMFNGSSYISLGQHPFPVFSNGYTFSGWVKGSTGLVFSCGADNSRAGIFIRLANSNTINVEVSDGTAGTYNYAAFTGVPTNLNLSVFNFFAVVAPNNGSPARLYINNIQVSTMARPVNWITQQWGKTNYAEGPIGFGKNFYYNSEMLTGSIDQVRIFNRALSAGEVTTLYNESASKYTCTSPSPALVQVPTTAVKGSKVTPTLSGFTRATDTLTYNYAKTSLPVGIRSVAQEVSGGIADVISTIGNTELYTS